MRISVSFARKFRLKEIMRGETANMLFVSIVCLNLLRRERCGMFVWQKIVMRRPITQKEYSKCELQSLILYI